MKDKQAALIIALTFLMIGALIGSWYQGKVDKSGTITDTTKTTIIDTISYYQPVPVDSVAIRYVTISAPVHSVNVMQSVNISPDSINYDSVQIDIPITQKHYKDSLYDAYVSGYACALDSIKVYNRTEYITITKNAKRKRWGIGIQGGFGIIPRALQPYVGIGVQYNLLTF